MKVRILGCGPSGGVPSSGNRWGDCDPHNPKNRRLRCSALVQEKGLNILIDTAPDLRQQLLDAQISDIHAVLYTHEHADHTHGINDVAPIARFKKEKIPVYSNAETLEALRTSFHYAFDSESFHYAPFLSAHEITENPFKIQEIEVQAFEQQHGSGTSLGFRLGDMAYSTDTSGLSPAVLSQLKGIKLWVVDCLSYIPHLTHSYLEQTLDWIRQVKPERAVLTHMAPSLDYATLKAQLPKNVEPAYDGLEIDI